MYQQLTDEHLLQLMQNDDRAAFAEIYDRYWERMALYVLKVLRSSDDASDIVQEVFVSIWKRRQELTIHGPLLAYLLKAVRNLAIRLIESKIKREDLISSLSASASQLNFPVENLIEAKELENRLAGAIAKLPSRMQTVYVMSRNEQLSHREIAQQLGIAETTVKKQMNNALKVIRAEMGLLSGTASIALLLLPAGVTLW